MIVGIGVDVLDVARMEREAARDRGFLEQVFTPAEIGYCESRPHRAQHYAARFAVKEAVFKALETGRRDGASWHEVEVAREPDGRGRVVLHGRLKAAAARLGVLRIHVSISTTDAQAVANVVLESGEVPRGDV